jgi:hypothetical protein
MNDPPSVNDYSDAELLGRVVRNARSRTRRKQPRWVIVMELTALGSAYSHQLCRRFGMDPDEEV